MKSTARKFSLCIAAFLLFTLAVAPLSRAVDRTARQSSFVEFSLGGSSAIHEYDRLGTNDFVDQDNRPAFLAANRVFDPTLTVGLGLGQLVNDQYTVGFGFRYTHVNLDRYARQVIIDDYRYDLYELGLDVNVYLLPHSRAVFSPYLGAGVSFGAFSESAPGLDVNADLVGDLHLNFGADIAVFDEASTGGRLTLSSINSVSLGALNERPRYLTLGAGVRYFLPR